jgi:hypothetical protein
MAVSRTVLARTDLPLCLALAEAMPVSSAVPAEASGPTSESKIPWRTWVSTSPNDNDQANIDYHFD